MRIQYEIQHFLGVENLKNYRKYDKIKKHKLPKIDSTIPFISHFYSLLLNVSTRVQTDHLDIF